MSHEDIEKWSKMYGLSGEEIFQLDAEFEALMQVETQEIDKYKLKLQGRQKDNIDELVMGR